MRHFGKFTVIFENFLMNTKIDFGIFTILWEYFHWIRYSGTM
jgi:hypothetical protein